MSKIIFLCSSSDLNWVDEYSEEHHFLNDGYVLEYEFGNSYITELIDDVKYICNNNKNYFIHTYSKEVLELFSKYVGNSDLKFVRLYKRDGQLRSVNYNKEEFIENVNEGWDLR